MSTVAAVRQRVSAWPWVWSYLAVFATWLAIAGVTEQFSVQTLQAAFALVPFLVIVGIGQMFVITLGVGNIDLSVSNVIPLAAFVSVSIMDSGQGSILGGFAAALGFGLAVAAINVIFILALKIPPIVATLATGLMAFSAAALFSGGLAARAAPALRDFTQARIAGLSVLGLLVVLAAVVAGFVLHRTTFGRSVTAIGQNRRAASLAGIPVNTVITITYIVSAVLAACAGTLLGAFSLPSLSMGGPYLLNSVAVVVLGGSLIAGGHSNVAGVWGSAVFLLLLTTLLNVLGINVATQNILKGLIIILVLSLVGVKRQA